MAASDQQSVVQENDGSLNHAVLEMPDFGDDLGDPSPGQTTEIIDPREANNRRRPVAEERRAQNQRRDDNGKFADGFVPGNLPPEAEVLDDKASPDAIEASAADEEWFELPPEKEGAEPKRIKAEEVWKGYQEREQLLQYVENLTRITPPPPQYDDEIIKTAQVRHRLVQELQQMIYLNQPQEPDDELLNDRSGRYDDREWHRQKAFYKQQKERIGQLNARLQHEQTQLKQEQEALTGAKRAREQSKLVQFWPELRDPTVQRQVRDDAARYFGIDDGVFDSVMDARFYAVLRYALDNVNGQRQRQNTVKVVRQKPKLVKGSARDSASPKTAQYQTGMRSLQRSGSLEDAADALGGLI